MREIKFRYTVTRKNGYIFSRMFTLQQIESGEYETWMKVNNIWAHDIHRDQFTGLRDKNGKEIYEGDIVFLTVEETFNASDEKGVIVWVNSIHAHFGIEFDSVCLPVGDERLGLPEEDFEVIGNIYENPELL